MKYEHKINYKHITTDHWTPLTLCCYLYKTKCAKCPESIVCARYNYSYNEYNIKPIKYAMLKTLEKIGKPKGENDV